MSESLVDIATLLGDLQSVRLELLDAGDSDSAGVLAMAIDSIVSAWQSERI